MPHPYANRSVKCAFRWYQRANLRARRTSQCGGTGGGVNLNDCPRPLYFPASEIQPFEIFAGNAQDGNYGKSTPTAWVIKDTAGSIVFDMAAFLPLLIVEQFTGTFPSFNREYIILDLPTIVPFAFAQGTMYESEITTAGGTYFSETFTFVCGVLGENIFSHPTVDGSCTNWSYLTWAGMVQGVVASNADLPVSPAPGDTYISLDDDLIYSWNGASYDTNPGTEDNYYTTGICDPIYHYHAGGFEIVTGLAAPFDPEFLCWHGQADIPVSYLLGADLTAETIARLNFNAFYGGSPFVGTLEVYVDDVLVWTFDSSNNGQGMEVDVLLETDSTVEFRPVGGYKGCLTQLEMRSLSGGLECYHQLTWRNCGDVGTQRYKYRDFTNILYLDSRKDKILFPEILFKVRTRQDTEEGDVVETSRKDVRWEIEMEKGVPWYLLDALTEIPLHDTVTLRLANEDGTDTLRNVLVSGTWVRPEACLADCVLTFLLDESTFVTGCCDSFDPACITKCVNATGGLITEHWIGAPEQEGLVFLADDGTYATYWGTDQMEHPVDVLGFGEYTRCTSGFATTSIEGFESVYFTGDSWFPAVYITEVTVVNRDTGTVIVSGNVMAQYGVRIEWSPDGGSWTAIVPVFTSEEIGSGVEVVLPEDAAFVRLVLVGPDECEVATSVKFDNPCFFCRGAGYASLLLNSTGVSPALKTDSGFWSMRKQDGSIQTAVSEASISIPSDAPGFYCFYASDGAGVLSGTMIEFHAESGGVLSGDFRGLTPLQLLDLVGNAALTSVNITGLNALKDIQLNDCALTQACVDHVIAVANVAIASGDIETFGGTASAPSGASSAKITALIGNGWSVSTN